MSFAAPKGNIIFDFLIYNDIVDSNDPEQRIFDYSFKSVGLTFAQTESRTIIIPPGTFDFALPAGGIRHLFLQSDSTLTVRLNGDVTSLYTIVPDNSDVANGCLYIKSSISSATLVNGNVGNATLVYFWAS